MEPETTSQSTGHARKILIIVLSIIIVLALVFIAFFVGKNLASSSHNASEMGSQESSASSQENQSQTRTDPRFPQAATRYPDRQLAKKLLKLPNRDPKNTRSIGKANAPVVMMAFSDFSCPLCGSFELNTFPQLKPLIDNGTLRFEFYNAPIYQNPYRSDIGALGGIAASNQGKFFEYMHNAAETSSHRQWSDKVAEDVARQSGVPDMAQFNKDLHSQASQNILQKDNDLIHKFDVSARPFFVINDRLIIGAVDTSIFTDTIKAAAHDVQAEKTAAGKGK